MTQISGSNPLLNFDDSPRPGGARRFTIAALVAASLLCGTVYGVYRWMRATSKVEYTGPEKLTFPEHRYYR